jgi:hypothetical protein
MEGRVVESGEVKMEVAVLGEAVAGAGRRRRPRK